MTIGLDKRDEQMDGSHIYTVKPLSFARCWFKKCTVFLNILFYFSFPLHKFSSIFNPPSSLFPRLPNKHFELHLDIKNYIYIYIYTPPWSSPKTVFPLSLLFKSCSCCSDEVTGLITQVVCFSELNVLCHRCRLCQRLINTSEEQKPCPQREGNLKKIHKQRRWMLKAANEWKKK